jgi:hypothetical protein
MAFFPESLVTSMVGPLFTGSLAPIVIAGDQPAK